MNQHLITCLLLLPGLTLAAPLPKEKSPKPKTPGEITIGTLKHVGEDKYSFTYTSYTKRPEDRQKVISVVVDGVEELHTVNYTVLIPEAKQTKLDLPSRGSTFRDMKGEQIENDELKKMCKTGIIAVILRADNDAEWCKFLADDVVIIEMSTGMRLDIETVPGLFDTKTDLPPVIIK